MRKETNMFRFLILLFGGDSMLTYPIILLLIVVLGALITENERNDAMVYIVSVIYLIPTLLVLIGVAVIVTPFEFIYNKLTQNTE